MIRQATLNDVNDIIEIAEKSWASVYLDILSRTQYDYMLSSFYNEEAISRLISEGKQIFVMFNFGDKTVGFASYQLDYPETGTCKIHKLYLSPDVQKTGGGKALVNYIEEVALANDCTTLTLNVNKYNPAKGFYEKVGFNNVKAEVIDIGQGYVMDDFVMEKPVYSVK